MRATASFLGGQIQLYLGDARDVVPKLGRRFAEMDLWTFEQEVAAQNRERQRQGYGSLPVCDQLYMKVLGWLEKAFPEPKALPRPGRAA